MTITIVLYIFPPRNFIKATTNIFAELIFREPRKNLYVDFKILIVTSIRQANYRNVETNDIKEHHKRIQGRSPRIYY